VKEGKYTHNNTDVALFILQNHTDLEEPQGACSEICPALHDTSSDISIKAEVLSDTEEEYPTPITFMGIKAEPEVSCVSVSMLWEFTNKGFFILRTFILQIFAVVNNLYLKELFLQKQRKTHTRWGRERLCGLVVRVLGYRSGGPGSIPGTTRKKK
jgi:hypothetical protein